MSVIQKIRDKYAKISVIAIALALLGFILMDAFTGKSNLFSGNSTTLGSINGQKIDYLQFEKKVKSLEEYQQAQGYETGEAGRQQIVESAWTQEINQILMNSEIGKLGMGIGKKELTDILFGKNPPEDLKKRFTDPNTGIYDAAQAQQLIAQVKKSRNENEREQLNQYLTSLEYNRLMEKYSSLMANTINFPNWLLERENADNSQIARVSYVTIPYTTISDSLVKISDGEIKDYINKHKDDYKQKENRSISYVVFDAAPTHTDSFAVKGQLEGLKADYTATADPESFLNRYGSAMKYFDGYTAKSQMQMPNKDTLQQLSKNAVFGPYVDGANYVIAKMLDIKTLPDSAKVRHILIQTFDPQSKSVLMDDSTAKKRIDSIELAIKNGASFDSLAKKLSDDKGSAEKGGVYDYFPQGQMVKAFNDFVFDGKVGDRKVVKTEFGYHLIEILGQKGSQPYYKIAYLAKPIVPSDETDNNASNQASLFAGDSRDEKSFDSNFEKNLKQKGINKLIAKNISPNAYTIEGIGSSRPMVKAIYEAKRGEVLQPVRVGDKYVVAVITEINDEGLANVETERRMDEPILRNKKKALQIKQKIGKITTLEAVSTAMGKPVQVADSIRLNQQNPALGFEYKVIGATFNPANKGKVVPEPIEGQAGVYVERVDNVGTTPVESANIAEQRKAKEMQARQAMMYGNQYGNSGTNPVDILRKAATIKDRRAKFY